MYLKNLSCEIITYSGIPLCIFQYNAIATTDAFNMQVYVNTTIEGDVLRYDDHVIRGMLLWKWNIMCN
jgi:hypothetical protein